MSLAPALAWTWCSPPAERPQRSPAVSCWASIRSRQPGCLDPGGPRSSRKGQSCLRSRPLPSRRPCPSSSKVPSRRWPTPRSSASEPRRRASSRSPTASSPTAVDNAAARLAGAVPARSTVIVARRPRTGLRRGAVRRAARERHPRPARRPDDGRHGRPDLGADEPLRPRPRHRGDDQGGCDPAPLGPAGPRPRRHHRSADRGRRRGARGEADDGADQPIEILFTSGSTGNPKGVTMTQAMLLASTERCLRTIPAGGNRFVSILPLSHIMEQVAGLIYAVAASAETEYITTLRPDLIAAAIRATARPRSSSCRRSSSCCSARSAARRTRAAAARRSGGR